MSTSIKDSICSDSYHFTIKSQTLEIFRAATNFKWYEETPEEIDEYGTWPATRIEFRLCKKCSSTLSFDVMGINNYVVPEIEDSDAANTAPKPGSRVILTFRDSARDSYRGLELGGRQEDRHRSQTVDFWCSCC